VTSSVPGQPEARGSGPADLNLVLAGRRATVRDDPPARRRIARQPAVVHGREGTLLDALPREERRPWLTALAGIDSLHSVMKEMAR
jgi:hypothetical protein